MGDREDRKQKEKECRGAVADPPGLHHKDSRNGRGNRQGAMGEGEEKLGDRLWVKNKAITFFP